MLRDYLFLSCSVPNRNFNFFWNRFYFYAIIFHDATDLLCWLFWKTSTVMYTAEKVEVLMKERIMT
ncbi:hypothetical protein BCR42DRAFT_406433 [Absidia repens]|uniref:TLC domain-containing protein n=1 Tax=Absidia repens TaxID=90262 RepID=A0A1X2IUV2_9FUNG|nr:hypothetical protein BCR42DRAFT_406433 [Absidia repens]